MSDCADYSDRLPLRTHVHGTTNMSASRLACLAVAFGLLGSTAQAQRLPVVQVAAEIEIATDNDVDLVAPPRARQPPAKRLK